MNRSSRFSAPPLVERTFRGSPVATPALREAVFTEMLKHLWIDLP
jgi:hypothetical protein